jgi:hypothetical protein
MSFKKEHRQETLIYLAMWAMLLIAPVLTLAIRTANTDIEFDWSEILTVWKEYLPFFIVFLIHNHLFAPQLIYRQRKWLYVGGCLTLIILFQTYECNHRPDFREIRRHRMEQRMERRAEGERPPLPPDGQFMPDERPPFDFDGKGPRGDFDGKSPRGDFDGKGPMSGRRPPLIFGQHDIIAIVILILMMGMNLALKLYFRQRGDQEKMKRLEKENLEQQLEYLKYQINPHFFMNTLNNIHALVDIDPEKAKTTILELSKMMRFVLYEGNKQGVPLDREIAFLQNYITLMKLRYTDKVRITMKTPDSIPNKDIPPLIFITFVENAFKHGVSYQQDSFIDICIEVADDLIFTCRNSRIPKEEDKHGGVGLQNVRQRLDLIYGDSYSLDINDQTDTYTVCLKIPLNSHLSPLTSL